MWCGWIHIREKSPSVANFGHASSRVEVMQGVMSYLCSGRNHHSHGKPSSFHRKHFFSRGGYIDRVHKEIKDSFIHLRKILPLPHKLGDPVGNACF